MINKKNFLCCWPYYRINPLPSANNSNTHELMLVAECVSVVYSNFYQDFIQGKNSDLICPQMDDKSECVERLANLINSTNLEKITIVRIEKNCCGFLLKLVQDALKIANKKIPIQEKIINHKGKVAEIKNIL
ncbi:MAG: hypothetical protein GXW85_13200 [Clostridia bacterium]|nr:hypothetical protein [Clostridia bacterium]